MVLSTDLKHCSPFVFTLFIQVAPYSITRPIIKIYKFLKFQLIYVLRLKTKQSYICKIQVYAIILRI